MEKKVYLETSTIGAYFETRTDGGSVSQRFWTRKWWHEQRSNYETFVSQAVVDELEAPGNLYRKESLNLIKEIPKLNLKEEISQIVEIYIQNQLMPQDPFGDALHLALASYYKCDYLLTWNCKHIANPNKFGQIRLCNYSLGLFVPTLVTPNLLIGD